MTRRQVDYCHAFLETALKARTLTGLCIAVLSAWGVDLHGAEPADVGSWDGPYCWAFGATHQAHLPPSGDSETGRVLMFPAIGGSTSVPAVLWSPQAGCFGDFDPDSDCFTDVSHDQTNLFCAGHTALADGTILTAGGHNGSVDGADVGLDHTNHFIRDPFTGEWGVWVEGLPPMAMHRWYPTVTTLPDGRALVVSGSDSHCHDGPNDGEQCSEGPGDALDTCKVCVGGLNEGDPCAEDGDCDEGTCDTDGTCEIFVVDISEIYDPAADPLGWTQIDEVSMDVPYYPLNFVLPDGKVVYAGAEGTGGGSPSIPPTQTWVLDLSADPATWTQQGNSSIPGGSAVMFEPGKVLKSGGGAPAVAGAEIYDWTTGTWMNVAPMNHARRRHQLTLLPDGTVLATGGTRSAPEGICVGGDDEGKACTADGDCDDGTCLALEARHNREYASSCNGGSRDGLECSTVAPLEPNCSICVGGSDFGDPCENNDDCEGNCRQNSDQGCPDGGVCVPGAQTWVATAEIYDPDTSTWTEMADAQHPRMYHSSCILLPDGRVVSAGGGPRGFGDAINSYPTVEFFSPPYYFKERPELTSAPSAICYDETFAITTSDALDVSRVTLVRLGTTTHSFDSDQRFLELEIDSQGANVVNVVAPDNANVAPPGYYMLFVLTEDQDGDDVPSVGRYVQIVDCCIPTITIPGAVVFDDTCVGDESTATLEVCNTGCDNLHVTSIESSDTQFSVIEPFPSGFPVVISPDFCFPFEVRFAPLFPGPQSAILAISSNDPTAPAVQVMAMGTGAEPDMRITGSGEFGDVCAGELAETTISVCNVGLCNLNVDSASVDCEDFTLINSPFPAPVSHDFCIDLVVRFTPTSAGSKMCTLTIESDDPDTPEVEVPLEANTPLPSIDVPPNVAFPPTVVQLVDACTSSKPFPISNTGTCDLIITEVVISENDIEYSLAGLPSFPIILEPGHVVGEGDLRVVFAPNVLDRARLGQVSVTYVSEPILGHTETVVRDLCGEGVFTGARVLVTLNGAPVAEATRIMLQRITANRNRDRLDTIDNARNLPLVQVIPNAPCAVFQYHREYGTVSNPIQLLPGAYNVTAQFRDGKMIQKTVGFDVSSCDFNPTAIVDLP